jgi:uncharacterized cupin superfamily protein
MIESFNAIDIPVTLEQGPGAATGLASVVASGGLESGVWVHEVGTSTGDFGDEMFVVLEGRGYVVDQHGGRIDLAPGVVGVLRAGDITSWTVVEPLRKVWITTA